jgi:hypothetical protein
MNILYVLAGGLFGGMTGWAFATASFKRNNVQRKHLETIETKRKLVEMKEKVKKSRISNLTEMMQGYLLYSFALLCLIGLVIIMF